MANIFGNTNPSNLNDILNGTSGIDFIFGDTGNDLLRGAEGNDVLFGDYGDDVLRGDAGNDILYGGEGDDILDGGLGDDIMIGGNGDDTYVVNSSGDKVIETITSSSWSYDTVEASLTWSLANTPNVEKLVLKGTALINGTGNNGNNSLEGNTVKNILNGLDGSDLIKGFGGDDVLNGGNGNDDLYGGIGLDTLSGGNNNDEIYGEDGNDLLKGDSGEDLLRGGIGNDILEGGLDDDYLSGDEGADRLIGGAGNDFLTGSYFSNEINNDIINGTQFSLAGQGEKDTLYSSSINDRDIFVLGERVSGVGKVYYDGGLTFDYALIADFDREDGSFNSADDRDRIQLLGSANNYSLSTTTVDGKSGTGIFAGDDLIALVQSVLPTNLSLTNSAQFIYV